MGSDMVESAKKYHDEQWQIKSEITEFLKKVITPTAEENKKVREDLHTVYQRFKN